MPDGNVTKFPGPRRPLSKGPELRPQAVLVYVMGVTSFGLFMSGRPYADLVGMAVGVAAVAIAAGKREDGPAWVRSHYDFALRTIVIAAATVTLLSLVTFLPVLILAAWFAKLAVGVWLLVRCLVGIFQALRLKPIRDSRTLLL